MEQTVRERCPVALLLIDVINDMNFEGSEALVAQARVMATALAALKRRAAAAGIPAIYVNDNFGRWRSDFKALIDHCINDHVPGREVARTLRPTEHDYFVLKPKVSAFYGTALDVLLRHLGTRTVILTGIAGNICVLFSAADAHIRDFNVCVPADCVASNSEADTRAALTLMRDVLSVTITESRALDLESMLGQPD